MQLVYKAVTFDCYMLVVFKTNFETISPYLGLSFKPFWPSSLQQAKEKIVNSTSMSPVWLPSYCLFSPERKSVRWNQADSFIFLICVLSLHLVGFFRTIILLTETKKSRHIVPSVCVIFSFFHQHLIVFASLGTFIHRYFILFCEMVSGIVSLISLSNLLLLVYRNAT